MRSQGPTPVSTQDSAGADPESDDGSPSPRWVVRRRQLLRWYASSAAVSVPQAAAPVAFSLLAVSLIGEASGGAAMMLSMTVAQVVAAIPVTRLGRKLPASTFLRLLVAFRTLALGAIAFCAYHEAAFAWLIVLAAVAGSVGGAVHGHMRALLNQFTPAGRLPRALGIAATLNETTFVLAPVLASTLGSISPTVALLAMTAIGAVPFMLLPRADTTPVKDVPLAKAAILSPAILLWLTCAATGASTIAAIEIGAVALALKFGYPPALAILFTVPLCLASVAGGIWVSVRNRAASRKGVVTQLSVMTLGSALTSLGPSLVTTIVGAVLIGSMLAPLGTHYSLALDKLAPPGRRPEVFALLRTAISVGAIFASAALTAASLTTALLVVTAAMAVITLAIGLSPVIRRSGGR